MAEKIDAKLAQINNNHENKPFEPDRGWQFEASSESNWLMYSWSSTPPPPPPSPFLPLPPGKRKADAIDKNLANSFARKTPKTKNVKAYHLFMRAELKEEKAKMKEQNWSKETVGTVMKAVSSRWKSLSSEEKAKWDLEGKHCFVCVFFSRAQASNILFISDTHIAEKANAKNEKDTTNYKKRNPSVITVVRTSYTKINSLDS